MEFYIQPFIILLTALIAAYWAHKTIKENRSTTKKKCTIDYLMDISSDERYVGALRLVAVIHNTEKIDIKYLADPNPNIDFGSDFDKHFLTPITLREAKTIISYVLNKFEYLAVAVNNDIYDEQILKDGIKTTTIQLFNRLEPYIERTRDTYEKNNPRKGKCSFYEHFENLVKSWEDN